MKEFPIKVPAETLNAINHGPYQFNQVHSYQILFRSDPDLVASLVPEPLIANRSGNMGLVIAQYHGGVETPAETLPGYNEVVIGVPAKYRDGNGVEIKGLYMVQLYLSDREPLSACDPTILGLVIPGYPKRICQWQEFVQDQQRTLRVSKRATDILTLHIKDAPLAEMKMPPVAGSSFLLKYIPSANEALCADVLKLNLIEGTTEVTAMAMVEARFENNRIRLDTGVELPVQQITMATRSVFNMLPTGNRELINYLEQS